MIPEKCKECRWRSTVNMEFCRANGKTCEDSLEYCSIANLYESFVPADYKAAVDKLVDGVRHILEANQVCTSCPLTNCSICFYFPAKTALAELEKVQKNI
jgi:hypothetical protein